MCYSRSMLLASALKTRILKTFKQFCSSLDHVCTDSIRRTAVIAMLNAWSEVCSPLKGRNAWTETGLSPLDASIPLNSIFVQQTGDGNNETTSSRLNINNQLLTSQDNFAKVVEKYCEVRGINPAEFSILIPNILDIQK